MDNIMLNPFKDAKLPYNDELIAKYSAAFVPTSTGKKLLDIYATFPLEIARGVFVGYLHAYSLLSLNNATETTDMVQLKLFIQAVCRRICESPQSQ